MIAFSEIESRRFNANIFRASLTDLKASSLKRAIIDSNSDILILRIPTETKGIHSSLANMGFPYIHADSLVYYLVNLNSITVNNFRNELTFEVIDNENVGSLAKIIPLIFEGYQNHYYSNPFFSPEKINAGYVEWASSYTKLEEGRISWLVKKHGRIAGFATCSFNELSGECEGVLYGVMPEFAGQGIYSDIIRFTQNYFKGQGISKMWVSTQLQNYAVQKVWLREGFFLKKSYETYHINSFLNYSVVEPNIFDFLCEESAVENFASFCGDYNPLHFKDDYAISMGFDGKIAHGMIFQSSLSKHFGVNYPGEGTIFLENSNLFFLPVYPGSKYKCVINTIKVDYQSGLLKVIAKLFSSEGKLCLLSYNTLINKNLIKTNGEHSL